MTLFMTDKNTFHIKSKVWIEDDNGNVIFGLGRLKILEAIEVHGSLNAAAKALKMSYRGLWGKIKITEEGLGEKLLIKNAGGASGGGSQLTPLAKELIKAFREVNGHVGSEADRFFETVFSSSMTSTETPSEKN